MRINNLAAFLLWLVSIAPAAHADPAVDPAVCRPPEICPALASASAVDALSAQFDAGLFPGHVVAGYGTRFGILDLAHYDDAGFELFQILFDTQTLVTTFTKKDPSTDTVFISMDGGNWMTTFPGPVTISGAFSNALTDALGVSTAAIQAQIPVPASTQTLVCPAGGCTGSHVALGPCIAGTTVTMTTTGAAVAVSFSGMFSSGGPAFLGYLVDGNYGANQSSTAAATGVATGDGFSYFSASFNVIETGLAPGSHSFCLTEAEPSEIGYEIDHIFSGMRSRSVFAARELH